MARVWRSVILLAMSLAAVIAFQVYLDDMMAGLPADDRTARVAPAEADEESRQADEDRSAIARGEEKSSNDLQ